MATTLFKNLGAIWKDRHAYVGLRETFLHMYSELSRRVRDFKVPGYKKIVAMRVKNTGTVFIRLHTSDFSILREIFMEGEYAPVKDAKGLMGDVHTILDLGANAGLSLRYWRQLFPTARIVGVEPARGNARVCRINRNQLDANVRVIRGCVADHSGWVQLDETRSEAEVQIGAIQKKSATGTVRAYSIPDLCTIADLPHTIDLLKCDIEGAEESLFATCAPWISRVRFLMIEIHGKYTREKLLADLQRNGWSNQILFSGRKEKMQMELLLLQQIPAPVS